MMFDVNEELLLLVACICTVSIKVMKAFGETIRKTREDRHLKMRVVAEQLHIDPSLLSRIERGVKRPTRRQVIMLATILDTDQQDLLIEFISERILQVIEDEPLALSALRIAEEKIRMSREKPGRDKLESNE
jgi:HTH-type transcriptional regulator, competence development regulator